MKNLFIYFSIIFALAFAACSSDDENTVQKEETSKIDSTATFGDLDYLQNSLVRTDSLGKFLYRTCGMPLDEADTTIVFIGADDLEMAKEKFRSWVPDDSLIQEKGDVMFYDLTDDEGAVQGSVYFKSKEGESYDEMKLVAEVTFTNGASLKHVSKVYFIASSSWPSIGYSPYTVGDVLTVRKNGRDYRYVCIQAAYKGSYCICVNIGNKEYYCDAWSKDYKTMAKPSVAEKVSKILQKNWNDYVGYFKAAGMTLTKDKYWVQKYLFYAVGAKMYDINLSNGEISTCHVTAFTTPKRYPLRVEYISEKSN